MDKLILGILMIKKLTVYEIRAIIKANFQSMCSDSLGSIQAAIKKLHDAEMVIFSEYVERSVNKKQYAITAKGREEFMKWLQIPANIAGSKNMEIGKFFFMGMVSAEERAILTDGIIARLEKELDELLTLQADISDERMTQVMEHWKTDSEYYSLVSERAAAIIDYQLLTLQYGIDLAKFNIEWFKKLEGEKL